MVVSTQLKILLFKMGIFPKVRGEKKKNIFELPPPSVGSLECVCTAPAVSREKRQVVNNKLPTGDHLFKAVLNKSGSDTEKMPSSQIFFRRRTRGPFFLNG